jgi:hypothetical protein
VATIVDYESSLTQNKSLLSETIPTFDVQAHEVQLPLSWLPYLPF